nr:MAG TPA: hypothetical protein [Bacteriophage sp.]
MININKCYGSNFGFDSRNTTNGLVIIVVQCAIWFLCQVAHFLFSN